MKLVGPELDDVECPVFYPSEAEFKNFSEYITYLETTTDVLNFGLARIIPPKGWSGRLLLSEEYYQEKVTSEMRIPSPILQQFTGSSGCPSEGEF
jgi:hypothetical protein